MPTPTEATIKELAVRSAGRYPVFTDQAEVSTPQAAPANRTGATAVNGALLAMVRVTLHANPAAPAGGEATSATVRLWGFVEGSTVPHYIKDSEVTVTENTLLRGELAGLEYVFAQVSDADGTVTVGLGPCRVEY